MDVWQNELKFDPTLLRIVEISGSAKIILVADRYASLLSVTDWSKT
jgi:hypothetical protein